MPTTPVLVRDGFFNVQSDIKSIGYNYTRLNNATDPLLRVTSALIRDYASGITTPEAYNRPEGKGSLYIPIGLDPDNPTHGVKLPGATDGPISGIVVAGDSGYSSLSSVESQIYDVHMEPNADTHTHLSVKFKGSGVVVISPYTGVAPSVDHSGPANLLFVCTSATAGHVEVASTDALAQLHGCRVVAVLATENLVAYTL